MLSAGHCHEDESFTDGLCRELSEEIGVIPTGYELLISVDNRPAFVLEIYLVHAWRGSVSNRCPDEHSELGWFTVGEASSLPLADERYKSMFDLVTAKQRASQCPTPIEASSGGSNNPPTGIF